MTVFIQTGNQVRVKNGTNVKSTHALPPAVYTVKIDPRGELYLEVVHDFFIPSKLYFNTAELAERILNTFKCRPEATGVLLNGNKEAVRLY